MDRTPTIERHPDGNERDGWIVRTPYHEGFVADLRAEVPSADRRWWAESKAWWVAAEREEILRHLLVQTFGGYCEVDEDTGDVLHIGRDGAGVRQGGLF